MARINTNIPSVVAQFNLARAGRALENSLQRLSTGLRINRGADDPAGLIISERIGTDISGVEQAIRNGERASSVISTTEAALGEVNDLLNSIKALIVEAANTGGNSREEREANQLQIDSAIQSITRISNTARFGGLRLLDGNLDYITSGVASSALSKVSVFSASFIETQQLQVEVDVLASAQRGALYFDGNNGTITNNGILTSSITLQITGPDGVQEFSFPSGVSFSDIVDGINSRTTLTGIEAVLINDDPTQGLIFRSTDFGSGSFVSVTRVNTTTAASPILPIYKFDNEANVPDVSPTINFANLVNNGDLVSANRDVGRDVTALVNGTLGVGDGLSVSVNSTVLGVELLLSEDLGTLPNAASTTFDIIGGGALFQIGPEVTALQQVNIGVPSVAASALGGVLVDGGLQFLSSLAQGQPNAIEQSLSRNDFSTASQIIEAAIDEVTILRGRLGAFERNVLDTNRRSLQSQQENLSASRSLIRDADFALETSALTRNQILQSSGTTVLGLANTSAQQVLQLLG